jgi:hypothetical protein
MGIMSQESSPHSGGFEAQTDVDESSIEYQLAGETLALRALMIARAQRARQFESKRLDVRADQALSNHPHLRMSKTTAKNIIRALEKKRPAPQHLDTDSFLQTEPIGVPGEEMTLSMYAVLDRRPMPPRSGVVESARLRIYALAGSADLDDLEPVYDIRASRLTSGEQQATVMEDDKPLSDEELFAPFGFVLAAKKQYE